MGSLGDFNCTLQRPPQRKCLRYWTLHAECDYMLILGVDGGWASQKECTLHDSRYVCGFTSTSESHTPALRYVVFISGGS